MNHLQSTNETVALAVDSDDPISRFIEQMGLMFAMDGMPRIAGRILGLLIVEDGSFSISAIAERLRVSRASVSTNARMLASHGVVERVGKVGDRQDYYRIEHDPPRQMLEARIKAFRDAAEVFDNAAKSLPPERAEAKKRIRRMAAFHRAAADTVAKLLKSCAD